jgi:hypothetical protein
MPAQSIAELLRDLGVVLRWRMQRGAGTDRAPLLPQQLGWESRLALRFVDLRTSVQVRAMVEDWPLSRIQEVVQAQGLETLGPQEGFLSHIGPQRGADRKDKRAGHRRPGLLIWPAACGFAAGLAAGIIGRLG